MAEAKASLVRIKELETQLELKEEKKDEHQECGRQLTELQARLKRETRRADLREKDYEYLNRSFSNSIKWSNEHNARTQENADGWYEKCQRLEEELTGRKETLKLEQEKNAKLVQALELEKQKGLKLEQAMEQVVKLQQTMEQLQSQLPGGQEMPTPPRVAMSPGYSGPARWPTFFGPAERGYSGHAGPAPPGCGHPPDPEQS